MNVNGRVALALVMAVAVPAIAIVYRYVHDGRQPPPPCPEGPVVLAHLRSGPQEAGGARLTICRGDRCATGSPADAIGGDESALAEPVLFSLSGSYDATATLLPQQGGWFRVKVPFEISQSDMPLEEPYTISVTTDDGALLLDVKRRIRYENLRLIGTSTGPTCRGGTIEVWPESKRGLTCDALPCTSGARLTLAATLGDPHRVSFRACLNDQCDEGAWPSGATRDPNGYFRLRGPIQATVVYDKRATESYVIAFEFELEPAVLADGDRYSGEITLDGKQLKKIEKVASYAVSRPNGPACDPYSCRYFEYTETNGSAP